jgi:hypothetical protein
MHKADFRYSVDPQVSLRIILLQFFLLKKAVLLFSTLPQYDIVMLFTGLDMARKVAQVCVNQWERIIKSQ